MKSDEMPASGGFYTVEEAASRLNVSTKTISRWRKQGLRSELRLSASRYRVMIRAEWLDTFIAEHSERVEKGCRFSQMTPAERDELLERARRMAAVGMSLTEAIQRLAQSSGRSRETVRYTLKKHDTHNPQDAIFGRQQRSLDTESRERLLREYRQGTPVERLAEMFGRTKTSIYRILAEVRANRIRELDLDFIRSPELLAVEVGSDEERVILGELPQAEGKPRRGRQPGGLPAYLASLYTVPLLTFEQERHLFRKMNYLKMRASRRRDEFHDRKMTARDMDLIESDFDAATDVKNQIVTANLRLVVSIAKRHTTSTSSLFDLISDGNMSLIRAVEKFDYSRGNRFSTYGSWAIMKNFSRAISDEQRYNRRFLALDNDSGIEMEVQEYDQAAVEADQARKERQVANVLRHLTPREQQIIIRRFGLNRDREPLTLKQVGLEMGVTKERIRQIEILALNKLRQLVADNVLQLLPARTGG